MRHVGGTCVARRVVEWYAGVGVTEATETIAGWITDGHEPTAILAASIMLLSALSLFTGFILDTVTHGRREAKRLAYLAQQPPPATNRSGALRDTDQSR